MSWVECRRVIIQYNLLDDKNEAIVEPVTYDGFGFRTIDEDIKHEEYEKTNKGKNKLGASKKK
jgi:hypothetical protein